MWFRDRLFVLAVLLACTVTGVTWHFGARAVGGADSYGYASQADAWLSGHLIIEQPWVHTDVPPFSERAFAPLGWRLKTETSMVPIYSTGYPMMMATAKRLGGHGAIFVVAPLCAGLLVFATFLIGARVASRRVGLLAAALVATSATVLHMSMVPMSDVPSAAVWTLALALTLMHTRRGAIIGWLVAALAIVVRPNLVVLAALMTLWLLVQDWSRHRGRWSQWCAPWFAVFAGAGVVTNASLNTAFYGSATLSGYGDLGNFYAWAHMWPNVRLYLQWIASAESPLAVLALAATICPVVLWGAGDRARPAAWLIALSTAYVFALYCGYLVFESWWYLRFMLPMWPALAVTTAIGLVWLWEHPQRWARASAVAVALAVMTHGVVFAVQHDSFTIGLTESRYPAVARVVSGVTDPDAAIITLQHSGTVRYYGGRITLRWDFIEPEQLDPALRWLSAHGHRPYLLLDKFELEKFRDRFAGYSEIADVRWTPSVTLFRGETMLFDVADRTRDVVTTNTGAYTRHAVPPVARPHW